MNTFKTRCKITNTEPINNTLELDMQYLSAKPNPQVGLGSGWLTFWVMSEPVGWVETECWSSQGLTHILLLYSVWVM